MKTKIGALLLAVCGSLPAATVQMRYLGEPFGSPSFFLFTVNGVNAYTLCDQYNPGVTTEPYVAILAGLSDLTGTVLFKNGDPAALQKYQKVGILASLAYDKPALAGDVTRAMRYIVDGGGALTSGAQALLDWLQTQNVANYSQTLSQFVIFAPTTAPGSILATQEQVGYRRDINITAATPEPASMVLIGGGLIALALVRLRRKSPQRERVV